MKRGTPITRKPMKRTHRKTGPDQNTVDLVIGRSFGMCERCARRRGEQIHHRAPRQSGGTRDLRINRCDNLTHLCQPCHSWVESNREQAVLDGWLWPRAEFERGDARAVKTGGRFVLLTPDGFVEELGEEA